MSPSTTSQRALQDAGLGIKWSCIRARRQNRCCCFSYPFSASSSIYVFFFTVSTLTRSSVCAQVFRGFCSSLARASPKLSSRNDDRTFFGGGVAAKNLYSQCCLRPPLCDFCNFAPRLQYVRVSLCHYARPTRPGLGAFQVLITLTARLHRRHRRPLHRFCERRYIVDAFAQLQEL